MRLPIVPLIGLLAAVVSFGGPIPITLYDAYGGPTPGSAKNNGDVIGLLNSFDIDTITFTAINAMQVEAVIRVNYNNGDATLSPFLISGSIPALKPADLLFEVDGIYTWGVPLSGHDLLTTGALYEVTNGQPFTQTARAVLNPPWYLVYRPDEAVWINAAHAAMAGENLGFDVVRLGQTSAVEITLRFAPTAQLLSAISRGITVHLASATCANDILEGQLQSSVPEPMTMVLAGLGLVMIAVARRGKRRQ